MKINFRAFRIGKMKRGQSMLKDMAMTVIATTISIILTFGSSSIIDKNQREKNRRQTVMMVIHDIEENVKQLREWNRTEEKNYELTSKVILNLDSIDGISLDTLKEVYDYLCEEDVYRLDDSKEKLFQENQEQWSSLDDNIRILDAIKEFFSERRWCIAKMNRNVEWKHPITQQDHLAILCEGFSMGYPAELAKVLKERLADTRVRLFIEYSYLRQRQYAASANRWLLFANKLKFMMGISDEELREYVESSEQLGKRAVRKDLIGKWVESDSTDYYTKYKFQSDGNVTFLYNYKYVSSSFSGYILYTFKEVGRWNLKGDTLYTTFISDSVSCAHDLSHVPYSEQMNDSLKQNIFVLEQMVQQYKKEKYAGKTEVSDKNYVRVDDDGKRLEIAADGLSLYYNKSDNVNN